MEKVRSIRTINKMLRAGKTTYLDPKNGYKYSLFATCPTDGLDCPLNSFEKKVGASSVVSRITFKCPLCRSRFDATSKEMFLM